MLPQRIIGFIFLPLVLSQPAQSAEQMVITLSCDGTVKDTSTTPISNPIPLDRTPKPVSKMGVVVNLAEPTVSFQGFVAPINTFDAANVTFGGGPIGTLAQIARKEGDEMRITGTLDRVAGSMEASIATGLIGRL